MIRVITTNKKLIEKFDISYTEDKLMDDNWLCVYVHHFHSETEIIKIDNKFVNEEDINKMVLTELIKKDRKIKLDKINKNIKSNKNIFKRLFHIR